MTQNAPRIPEVLIPPLSDFEALPEDVLLEVFRFLHDPHEVFMCIAASRRLKEVGSNPHLWRSYCKRKYATPQTALYEDDWKRMFNERNGFGNPFRAQRVYAAAGHANMVDEIAAVAVRESACLVAQGSCVHLLHLQPPLVSSLTAAPVATSAQPSSQQHCHSTSLPSSSWTPPSSSAATAATAADPGTTRFAGQGFRSPASAIAGAGPHAAAQLCGKLDMGDSTPTALSFLPGVSDASLQAGMPSNMRAAAGTLQGNLQLLTFEEEPVWGEGKPSHRMRMEPLVCCASGSGGIVGGGGSIPISQLCTTSPTPHTATVAALHDAFLNVNPLWLESPSSCVEFVDVAAQKRTGVAHDVMDSWSFVTIASHSSNSSSRSCGDSNACASSGRIANKVAPQASSAANPNILLAGSVSAWHCSRCWDAYLPWLCSHKQHAALAALCVCDTRHPGYVAERFALQHRSLYPQLATARGHYVFTSHADCPLCVWDLRRMSIPVFASNSRNLDHQTEGPLGRAANPAPNQAMLLDASEDLLLGRALNGTMWLWDLAELLGWQDSSGGLGVWEALEYLSPWESHSLPPKAWPVCLGALPPGANYLPVTCLLDASNPTSILLVTDPCNHDHASEGEGTEVADDEEALEMARQQQLLLEMGESGFCRAAGKEGESESSMEEAEVHGCSYAEWSSYAGQAGPSQAHAGAHIDGSRESGGAHKGWEGFGSWYSGEYGIGLDCWNCGARGHFMRDCPLLAAASVEVRGEHDGEWTDRRKGGWKYAVAREEHCGAGKGGCGAGSERDVGMASEGGPQDEGSQPWGTLWGEHSERGGASRGVEVCVDKGVGWVGGNADAWVDGAGDACDRNDACEDMDGNCGSEGSKGDVKEAARWHQQQQHLQQQPQQLSGPAEVSEGAAPVLSAGGIGEQLVRVSFCRRE